MKEYSVSFYFDEEFRITFQYGPNGIISFSEYNGSLNSKDVFFKKIEDNKKNFSPDDSFSIGQEKFTSLDDLIVHLKNKGVGIKFVKSANKEQKLIDKEDCGNCGGTGELYNKDQYGENLRCRSCDGSGVKKIWK